MLFFLLILGDLLYTLSVLRLRPSTPYQWYDIIYQKKIQIKEK
jgi:hypothetical protein